MTKDEQDKKDYQDYLDYQQYLASHPTGKAAAPDSIFPTASAQSGKHGTGPTDFPVQGEPPKLYDDVDPDTGVPWEQASKAGQGVMMAMSPVTTLANLLRVPKGPTILPEAVRNQMAEPGKGAHWYSPEKGGMLDPTLGGTVEGIGDMASLSPGAIKALAEGGGAGLKAILAKTSGMDALQAEAAATKPDMVSNMQKLLKKGQYSELQNIGNDARQSTLQNVAQQGADRAKQIKAMLADQTVQVPTADVAALAAEGHPEAQSMMRQASFDGSNTRPTLSVPGDVAYDMKQYAGSQAKFHANPLNGSPVGKDKAMSGAMARINQAIGNVGAEGAGEDLVHGIDAEANPTIGQQVGDLADQTTEGIGLQKKVKNQGGAALLKTSNMDSLGRMQTLAAEHGQPQLLDANSSFRAAQEFNKPLFGGHDLTSFISNLALKTPRLAAKRGLPMAENLMQAGKGMTLQAGDELTNPYRLLQPAADDAMNGDKK